MARFIDVLPGSTFYDDVMEANSTLLEDGMPLLNGMHYQKFEDGKPYIYQEVKASAGQFKFIVPKKIVPTDANPVYVMVDGVSWGYKEAVVVGETTEVTLYTAPKAGAIVSIMSYGVPKVDADGRPVAGGKAYYPSFGLQYKDTYVYWPYYGNLEEVSVFGKRLKRVEIDPTDYMDGLNGAYEEFGQQMARKYIGTRTDVYIIVEGWIHLPFNLDGVTCYITYCYTTNQNNLNVNTVKKVSGSFKPSTLSGERYDPYRNDRYFPDAKITRGEIIFALNRLRKHYLSRLTDKGPTTNKIEEVQQAYVGQKVFRLNGSYPSKEGKIKVYRSTLSDPNAPGYSQLPASAYEEFDDHTILLKQPAEEGHFYSFYYERTVGDSRFIDISTLGMDLIQNILEMEDDRLSSWEPVIQGPAGMYSNRFESGSFPSRYYVLATMHRFLEWNKERLIY